MIDCGLSWVLTSVERVPRGTSMVLSTVLPSYGRVSNISWMCVVLGNPIQHYQREITLREYIMRFPL